MKVYPLFPKVVSLVFTGLILMVGSTLSCSNKSSTNGSSGNITVTGTCVSGPAIVNLSSFSGSPIALRSAFLPQSGSVLGGYSLFCVTLSDPPVAGSATADTSGNFSLTFAAKDTPFGCFVEDTAHTVVAALVFSGTSGTMGQTVKLTDSTDFGTIMVDTSTGVALAEVPATTGTVVSTPASAPCPVGTWVSNWANVWASPCAPGNVTVIMYIVDTGSGLQGTFNIGPVNVGNPVTGCGTYVGTTNGTTSTITFANNVIQVTMPGDSSGCGAKKTMDLTVDGSCKTATLSSNTDTGCGDCTKPDTWFSTCSGCGSMICTNASSLGLGVTFTKQ